MPETNPEGPAVTTTDPAASDATDGQPPGRIPAAPSPRPSGAAAALVAAGILVSRLSGFIRERAFAHAFGSTPAADVFKAALRIPNLLQNLFGEGVLSASFVPVYTRLTRSDPAEARRVAGAVLGLLALVSALGVVVGLTGTPWLIDAITPGFEGEKREAAIRVVRVLFPGTGLLVVSAWCLAILNTHGRYFASYAAPVAWNFALVVLLLVDHEAASYALAEKLAWAAVVGSVLQVVVQLPFLLRFVRGMRPSLDTQNPHVRSVLAQFFPAVVGRGIVQINTYLESMLASLLPTGALALISYAQMLTTLPTSIFGSAIAVTELTEMSKADDKPAIARRLQAGGARIAFFVVPSAVAFAVLGDVVAAVVFQTGRFGADDARTVWAILAAQAIGLVASTQGRLVATVFYAQKDTRTPLYCALARVVVSMSTGALASLYACRLLGIDERWSVAGIGFGSSLGALVELFVLRGAARRHIDAAGVAFGLMARILGASVVAAVVARWAHIALDPSLPVGAAVTPAHAGLLAMRLPVAVEGILVLAVYGCAYLGLTMALSVGEARSLVSKVMSRLRRWRGPRP